MRGTHGNLAAALAAALALALAAGRPAAQGGGFEVAVSLVDGTRLRGELVGIAGRGDEANLALRLGQQRQSLPLARVLAVHGAPAAPRGGAVAYLVGGEQVRGEVTGGDEAGELLTLRSASLGEVAVAVDRLQALVFEARASGGGADAFTPPESADEVLFRPAARGFDGIVGGIHRFTERGVLFEWAQADAPQLYAYDGLAAVALRGGMARADPPDVHMLTRAGDVLRVALRGFENGELQVELEGGRPLSLPFGDVAVLTFLRAGRHFLSDLEPEAVVEQGSHLEADAPPLYRHRRDRSVSGGFLTVGGVPYGKGLGVHSRCVLSYRVPEPCTGFVAEVGIDDEVLATPVRGVATVAVRLDGELCFGPRPVRGGQPALSLGRLPVRGGALLTLEVDFGPGWFVGDRVDWLHAVLLE